MNPQVPANPTSPEQESYQAASLIVTPRPVEFGFALREDEFEILCDVQINEARAGRDFSLGLFLSAALGLVGLAATTDWNAVLHQGRTGPLVWMAILLVLVAGPGAAAIVHHRRYSRTRTESPHSHLRKRISQYFSDAAT